MKWKDDILKIKYYVIACAFGYLLFLLSGIYGVRILGDDNEAKEEAVTKGGQSHSHTNHFYHK